MVIFGRGGRNFSVPRSNVVPWDPTSYISLHTYVYTQPCAPPASRIYNCPASRSRYSAHSLWWMRNWPRFGRRLITTATGRGASCERRQYMAGYHQQVVCCAICGSARLFLKPIRFLRCPKRLNQMWRGPVSFPTLKYHIPHLFGGWRR